MRFQTKVVAGLIVGLALVLVAGVTPAEAAKGAARVAAIRPAANVRSKIGFRVFIIALLFWPAPRRWSLGAGSPSATRRPRFRDRMGALASATSMIRRTESPFDDCAHPGVVLGIVERLHRRGDAGE